MTLFSGKWRRHGIFRNRKYFIPNEKQKGFFQEYLPRSGTCNSDLKKKSNNMKPGYWSCGIETIFSFLHLAGTLKVSTSPMVHHCTKTFTDEMLGWILWMHTVHFSIKSARKNSDKILHIFPKMTLKQWWGYPAAVLLAIPGAPSICHLSRSIIAVISLHS